MSKWEQRFEDHALWSKLDAVKDKFDGVSVHEDSNEERDSLTYMSAIVESARTRKVGTPALLVSPGMLDAASAAVDAMSNSIDYWTSQQYNDDQMDQATDGLVQALASWPALTRDQAADLLSSSLRVMTTTTDEALLNVRQGRDELSASLDTLGGKVSAFETALTKQQAQVQNALTKLGADATAATESASEEWDKERAAQQEQAEARLEALRTLESEARELVHAATGSVVATDYGAYAKNKTIAAWLCDVAAAVIGAVGVAAIIYHLYQADTSADGDIGLSLTRLGASLGTLGIAALVAHRGHDHHKEARAAKRTDLALRRVGPFTANLSPDIRERIVVETTDRIFVRGELDDSSALDQDGTTLWDRIQRARREQEAALEQ